MNHPSSRAIDRAAPIIAILAIALMTAVSLGSLWPPTAPGSGPASFSAEHAMAHVKLVVDPAGGPVRITVVDQSPGIENPAAALLGPDTMYARSWVAGTTLVRRSYAF